MCTKFASEHWADRNKRSLTSCFSDRARLQLHVTPFSSQSPGQTGSGLHPASSPEAPSGGPRLRRLVWRLRMRTFPNTLCPSRSPGSSPTSRLHTVLHSLRHILKRAVQLTAVKQRPGRGGLSGCEMLRIPHCLDNLLTDGVVSRALLPRNIFRYSFPSQPQGLLRLEGSVKLKKFNDIVGTRTRDLLACIIVP
jgi:hypothetical protein